MYFTINIELKISINYIRIVERNFLCNKIKNAKIHLIRNIGSTMLPDVLVSNCLAGVTGLYI